MASNAGKTQFCFEWRPEGAEGWAFLLKYIERPESVDLPAAFGPRTKFEEDKPLTWILPPRLAAAEIVAQLCGCGTTAELRGLSYDYGPNQMGYFTALDEVSAAVAASRCHKWAELSGQHSDYALARSAAGYLETVLRDQSLATAISGHIAHKNPLKREQLIQSYLVAAQDLCDRLFYAD